MSIQEIESAIEKLQPNELSELADWFAEHHNAQWDEQIAADYSAGRLDGLIAQARAECEAGECTPL